MIIAAIARMLSLILVDVLNKTNSKTFSTPNPQKYRLFMRYESIKNSVNYVSCLREISPRQKYSQSIAEEKKLCMHQIIKTIERYVQKMGWMIYVYVYFKISVTVRIAHTHTHTQTDTQERYIWHVKNFKVSHFHWHLIKPKYIQSRPIYFASIHFGHETLYI